MRVPFFSSRPAARRRQRNRRLYQRNCLLESLEHRRLLTVDISIDDLRVDEDAGTAYVTVSLSQGTYDPVSVDYDTADGTASATNDEDYTSTSGTLYFDPFQTSQSISVTLTNDTDKESDQTFKVDLSNAAYATIIDSQAIVTIADNDATGMTNTADVITRGGNEVHAGDVAYNYI